ncbi:hypothetical protein [Bacillus toyonensis]|uniref:hypothetical protein n=1 Tax=Bacillus toyonensis TaxID=155322 RepID=UPI002E235BC2|nr:hypothetical protein [Bacillus toyonensis]
MNAKMFNFKRPNEIVHLDNLWNIWQRKVPYINQKDLGWSIWGYADRNNISFEERHPVEVVIMFIEENSYELKIGLEVLLKRKHPELMNMVTNVNELGDRDPFTYG